jgi:hypothetical protein
MSLKAFHVVFITASTLLTVAFGLWGIRQFSTTGDIQSLALGISSLIVAVALIIYGKYFLRKLKHISYL